MKIIKIISIIILLILLSSIKIFGSELIVDKSFDSFGGNLKYTAEDYFEKIPCNIKEKLGNSGWKLYMVRDLNYLIKGPDYIVMAGDNYYLGMTYWNSKIIFIDDSLIWSEPESIIHEIGHAIDCELNHISNLSNFLIIYQTELPIFYKTYQTNIENISNNTEYFAESFKKYILDPESLKNYCPFTYKWINNIITNF